MPSFLIVVESFVLQYIFEPNKLLYLVSDDEYKLKCTESKFIAHHFISRDSALKMQEKIYDKYGLEFQIVRL